MRALLVLSQQDLFLASWIEEIRKFGYDEISTAARADEAMSILAKEKNFDLILCDHNLQGKMSGLLLLETLRLTNKLPFTTSFVLVTASVPKDFLVLAQRITPDAVVIKPYSGMNIYNSVGKALVLMRSTKMIRYWMDLCDYDKAIDQCLKLKNNAHRTWCRNTHAEILLLKNDIASAKDMCIDEIKLYHSTWAIVMLVQIYLEEKEYKQAFNLIDSIPPLLKENVSVLKLLAECYMAVNEFEIAKNLLNGAVTSCPDNLHLFFSHAKAAKESKKLNSALSSMIRGLELSANSIYETEERFIELSDIAHEYCLSEEDKELELISKTHGLMKIGTKKFPHQEIFAISSQIFNICALQYTNHNIEAAELFEGFFLLVRKAKDKSLYEGLSRQILRLAQELPISIALKEMAVTWVTSLSDDSLGSVGENQILWSPLEKAAKFKEKAEQAIKNGKDEEAELLIEKGILIMPNHFGLNLTMIKLYLDILKRSNHPIDRLVNLSYRCFERISEPNPNTQFYQEYMNAKKELDLISINKIKHSKVK